MRTSPVTLPAIEPVTLTELKLHCSLTATNEDSLLCSLITAARMWIEEYTWHRMVTQTWDLFLNRWDDDGSVEPHAPQGGGLFDEQCYGEVWGRDQRMPKHGQIDIPFGWLQSVAFIKYLDLTNTQQTLDPSLYQVVTGEFGFIRASYDSQWPQVLDFHDAIQIRFVTGYGSTPQSVPQPVKLAIEQLAYYLYINREASVKDPPDIVYQLLGPYSVERLV